MSAREAAQKYLQKGLSVVAIAPNGSKAPAREVGSWTRHQVSAPDAATVDSWYPAGSRNGVAILGGAVSGHLTILDFDCGEAYLRWRDDCGHEGLLYILDALPIVRTPSGGRHVYCFGIEAKCAKLARNATGKTIIETKAEGGYVLAPGCPPECHASGLPYEWEQEGWMAAGVEPSALDPEIYDLFVVLARLHDEASSQAEERREQQDLHPVARPHQGDSVRPGDAFNLLGSWVDILEPEGWTISRRRDNVIHWRRPGKEDSGISATSGHCKSADGTQDKLHIFSTNAHPFLAGETISKFAAFARLKHAGDMGAAARALSDLGFGDRDEPATLILPGAGLATPTPAAIPAPVLDDDLFAIPFSRLAPPITADKWYWYGFICPGQTTIISALPKIGKTTLLAALLKAFEEGEDFCGYACRRTKVLYASEEHETSWSPRVARFGLDGDFHRLLQQEVRIPYNLASFREWLGLCRSYMERNGFSVLVLDTLSRFWPVLNENDAVETCAAIDELNAFTRKSELAVLVVHHGRKGGGTNGTAARGSTGITAKFDITLEFEKTEGGPGQTNNKKQRLIKGTGRWQETPDEILIELDGDRYTLLGEPAIIRREERRVSVIQALSYEWQTTQQIAAACQIRLADVIKQLKVLNAGGEVVTNVDRGTRGNPQLFKLVSMEKHTISTGGQCHALEGY